MDSTSTAGDSASEELQRVSAATSLEPATPRTQATEIRSRSMTQDGNKEDVQIRDAPKLDAAPDPPEAARASAHAGTKEDGQISTDDIKDDVSIASDDLEFERARTHRFSGEAYPKSLLKRYKQDGTKYARTTATYIESLEARVMTVERELLELQYDVGSKARPDEERQALVLIWLSLSSDYTPSPNSPCANPLPVKVMQLSLKDWKDGRHLGKWDKASVFLATNTGISSFQPKSIDLSTHSQGTTLQPNDNGYKYDNNGRAADIQRREHSDIARLAFSSPWPLILIELLSGESIAEKRASIYPFKHIVIYEKQIRKFVELLNGINVDNVVAKDLPRNLNKIVSEVVRVLGSTRGEVEYSDTYVYNVLQKRDALKNHHAKVQKSSAKDQEDELEVDSHTGNALSSTSTVDSTIIELPEPSNSTPKRNPVLEKTFCVCTCLRDAKEHLQLLVSTIDSHFGSLLILHKTIRDRAVSKISFEHLWHLFQPGDVVVTSRQPRQAYRVMHVSGGRPLLTTKVFKYREKDSEERQMLGRQSQMSPFNIDCVRFDFDGEKFGPVQDTIRILEYEDDRLISKLDVYPIVYAETEAEVSKTLLDRGRRFAVYRDFQHKRYEGLSLDDPQEEIESEVVVDFMQSFRQSDYAIHKPQIGIQGATRTDIREVYEDYDQTRTFLGLETDRSSVIDDTEFDRLQMVNFESRGMFRESRGILQVLTNDQLIILPCRVHGFSLRSRKWVSLDIDLLQDIKEHDSLNGQKSGFDDLVIPPGYKKTVKALVKSHTLGSRPESRGRQQIDLIRGKGKGLIILLHGVPGVGKTSTAESVASYTGRPLFPITCGDIGQTAYDVEKNLEAIFLLARKWGCVLLLDEADVFLAKREKGGNNIDRNALVSVFLRTLEYYSGILFLTTNRIGSFDEAFKSRIHISLYYAPLDEGQTFKVWVTNLNRLRRSNNDIYFEEPEIEAFARTHWQDGKRWNGRQIRNAFQTAVALAEYEFHEKRQKCEQTGDQPPIRPALETHHFEAVAKTSAEFDDYLQSVMGGQTYEQKAQFNEVRSDAYNPERGIDSPSGKKHSYQRAVRPSRSKEQPSAPESEDVAKQTPAAIPQLLGATSMGSSSAAPDEEEEEYRQFKAEREKQKQAEKNERFRKMYEAEQRGR